MPGGPLVVTRQHEGTWARSLMMPSESSDCSLDICAACDGTDSAIVWHAPCSCMQCVPLSPGLNMFYDIRQ